MQRKLARAARHGGSPITLEDRAAAQRCVARHCRLHGDAHAHCLRVPIQKRSHDSFAHGNGRVLRRKTGVNDEEGRLEPAEVDQVSRALRPMAATHLALTSPEHLFEVEPSLCPLLTLTDSPRRSNPAFGRFAGKWWLQVDGGAWLRLLHFGVMQTGPVLHAVAKSGLIGFGDASERRFSALAAGRLPRWL